MTINKRLCVSLVHVGSTIALASMACSSSQDPSHTDERTASSQAALSSDASIAYVLAAPHAQCTIRPTGRTAPSGTAFADAQGVVRFYAPPASWGTQLSADCVTAGNAATSAVDLTAASTFQPPAIAPPPTMTRPPLSGDPAAYSQTWLIHNRYPMRPDPDRASAAYAAWLKAVSKPVKIAPPQPIAALEGVHGPATNNNSEKFAGEVLVQSGVKYIGTYAYYVLPDTFTSGQDSFWTGIDGFGAPFDIIQSGVDATYKRHYAPWFEYYPNATMYMASPSVNFQDEVLVEAWSSPDGYCDTFSTAGQVGCGWIENVTTGIASGNYFQKSMNNQFLGVSADYFLERLCADSQCSSYSPISNFQQIWMQGEALDSIGNWHDYATDAYENLTLRNSTNQVLAAGMNSNGTNLNVITFYQAQ